MANPRKARLPGPPTFNVPVNLRPAVGGAGRRFSVPLFAAKVVLVVGVAFAAGYFVLGRSKDAVTSYASRRVAPVETQVNATALPPRSAPASKAAAKPSSSPAAVKPSEKSAPATPADVRSTGPAGSSASSSGASKSAVPTVERRKRDLYYFTLATYRPATAERLAAFWKANGLEAAIVSDDNAGLVQVVDLRGFTADQVGSPAFVKHETTLRALGRKWQTQEKGPDRLEHMNAAKFTGNIAAPKPASRLKKD